MVKISILDIDTIQDIETKLEKALKDVSWIGELDLDKATYRTLGKVIRGVGRREGKVKVDKIPDLCLITSMVFCAQYHDCGDEHPQFWEPYADEIWNLESSSPQFLGLQSNCRKAFRDIRPNLAARYGFRFPLKDSFFDVINGIYMHSILPHYLQDDFARWMIKLTQKASWASFLQPDLQTLAEELAQSESLVNERTRLQRFVTEEQTKLTAARLVQELAKAVLRFQEGISPNFIEERLPTIERPLWRELLQEFNHETQSRKARVPKASAARAEWVWAYEDAANDLSVRVRYMRLKSDTRPDRCVWVDQNSVVKVGHTLDYSANYIPLNNGAWLNKGVWEVDPVFISEPVEGSLITVVNEQDQALMETSLAIPTFQAASFYAFRVIQDNNAPLAVMQPGVPTTLSDWIIVSCEPVSITLNSGHEANPAQKLYPPLMLQGHGFKYAALYHLYEPFVIRQGEQILGEFAQPKAILPPRLDGKIIINLSAALPVVYQSTDVSVLFDKPGESQLARLWFHLIPDIGLPVRGTLQDLKSQGNLLDDEEHIYFSLDSFLNPKGGVYRLEIFDRLERLTPEPIRFAVLPENIQITPPLMSKFYTEEDRPFVHLEGLSFEDVLCEEGRRQERADGLWVSWNAVGQPCSLRLQTEAGVIQLEWHVMWVHVSAQLPHRGNEVGPENVEQVLITFQGKPKQTFALYVGDRFAETITLDAKGTYSRRVRDMNLPDVIRQIHKERFEITVSTGTEGTESQWKLFTYFDPLKGTSGKLPTHVQTAVRVFHEAKRTVAHKEHTVKASDIAMLPASQLENTSYTLLSTISPILETLLSARKGLVAKYAFKKQDDARYLQLLDTSDEIQLRVTELSKAGGKGFIAAGSSFDSKTIAHSTHTIEVTWEYDLGNTKDVLLSFSQAGIPYQYCFACQKFLLPKEIAARVPCRVTKGSHNFIQKLEGFMSLSWEQEFLKQDFDFPSIIDRNFINIYVQGKGKAAKLSNKTNRENLWYTQRGYERAIATWVTGTFLRQDAKLREATNRLIHKSLNVSMGSIQESFTNSSPTMVMIKKFLAHFRDTGDYKALDYNLLVLAAICRAEAYNLRECSQFQKWLPIEHRKQLLNDAELACPDLLAWAFGWIEFFFYNVSENQS